MDAQTSLPFPNIACQPGDLSSAGTPCWPDVTRAAGACSANKGHVKKGELLDTFTNAACDILGKGVLHYINIPAGSASPRGKRKQGSGGQNA